MRIRFLNFYFSSLIFVLFFTLVVSSPAFSYTESAAVKKARLRLLEDDGNPNLHYNYGVALYRQGFHAEANKEWDMAIKLNPTYAEPYMAKGLALYNTGRSQAAIAKFKQAILFKENLAQAHDLLATVYYDEGYIGDAIAEWEKALKIKPNMPETHDSLGIAYHQEGRYEEAIEEYKKELENYPDYVESYKHLVEAYLAVNSFEEAAEALQEFEGKVHYGDSEGNNTKEDRWFIRVMRERINRKKSMLLSDN